MDGELQLLELELELVQIINVIVQKIKARIQTPQSRQKSYVDLRHKNFELKVGDHVFLKVKLSPRFICNSKNNNNNNNK